MDTHPNWKVTRNAKGEGVLEAKYEAKLEFPEGGTALHCNRLITIVPLLRHQHQLQCQI